MKIARIIFLIFPLGLTGCVGMNSSFDCNVTSGGKCAPMTTINEMVDRGGFRKIKGKTIGYNQYFNNTNMINSDQLLRSNESVQQIWIAPYEDTNGIYHDASSVYFVAKKGSWNGKPPIAIIGDE